MGLGMAPLLGPKHFPGVSLQSAGCCESTSACDVISCSSVGEAPCERVAVLVPESPDMRFYYRGDRAPL